MLKTELTHTLNFLEQTYNGDMNSLDRYIDIKTLLGCYNRNDCPLSPTDREILIKHLVFGYTLDELTKDYGIHKSTISRRIERSLGELNAQLI